MDHVGLTWFCWLHDFTASRNQKKRRRHQELVEGLKEGQKVVTAGGIHGVVVRKGEHTVDLATGEDEKTVITFGVNAVTKTITETIRRPKHGCLVARLVGQHAVTTGALAMWYLVAATGGQRRLCLTILVLNMAAHLLVGHNKLWVGHQALTIEVDQQAAEQGEYRLGFRDVAGRLIPLIPPCLQAPRWLKKWLVA